ncbi:hypothetical protein [Desulfuribacillus alkaliarsenatis]|uniref:Uncharacterized protein n=1 Tax=Desulfuribacillus alkaliarsenatis TaxID=766136 RepID=A0A1E5G008_9FIRM|nr:hypothetical protein [Desulfuribacillus alkaliarsenatis]OEF96167.1 hypothetical protein BHF68_08340 [Desulfuribacillus alkaliarsenatis]
MHKLKLILVTLIFLLLFACEQQIVENGYDSIEAEYGNDKTDYSHTLTFSNISEAKTIGLKESIIIKPLCISQEMFLFTEGTLEWDGTDYYLMIAYDKNSDVVRIDVNKDDVLLDRELRIGEFILVEGQWVESEYEHAARIISASKVKVIDGPDDWAARPGDM